MHILRISAASLFYSAVGTSIMLPQALLMPTFPPPARLNINANFQSTIVELSSSLQMALSQGTSAFGNFTPNATSVSVSLKSTGQEDSVFDFQFTGAGLNASAGSTSEVSSDSVFRIGSISKLITVYALLLNNGLGHWEQPITKYVPELRNYAQNIGNGSQIDHVNWEDVTIRDLASHMSGIGVNYAEGDISIFPFPWLENGLPELDSAELPFCGADPTQPPCTREAYFEGFLKRHPVFPTQHTPVYSNTAFHLLGYALEVIAGDTFENILQSDVFGPLQLKNSGVRTPESGSGVIPPHAVKWDTDIGDETPSGGVYSTAHDLSSLGRNILLGTQLPPSVIRRWMKPLSHTSALTFSVGAPWEIYRTKSNITTGRTIDIYTKSGGIGSYTALLILIPDYEISLAVLTAGPDGITVNYIAEMIVQRLTPVLENSAKDESAKILTGLYISETGENSSLSLTMDSGPGLVVDSWISNGSNLLQTAEEYLGASGGGHVKSMRLYPTSLKDSRNCTTRASYRAIFDVSTEADLPTRVFDQNVNTWENVDQVMYGEIGVDDFVFELDCSGAVTHIEPRVLRSKLVRAKV